MSMSGIRYSIRHLILEMHGECLIELFRRFRRTLLLWQFRWLNRRRLFPAWREQNKYDKAELKHKTVVLFVLYKGMYVNGGVMSIFNMATTSRKVLGDAAVLLCTGPGDPEIYSRNTLFPNTEKVWRWGQVRHGIRRKVGKLILHVPECFVDRFLHSLSHQDRCFLKSIPELRINILNQNILQMPSRTAFSSLYMFTDYVSQTTAHGKYNSQEMSNRYGLPTMRIGTYMSYEAYKTVPWNQKEKLIAYSPDRHPMRDVILAEIRHSFPDYSLVEINNLTFMEYMALIARAMVVITFGEGLDGFFCQPPKVGTLSLAVYNTDFYPPGVKWVILPTVFESYPDMQKRISELISKVIASEKTYYEYVSSTKEALLSARLTYEQYESNIKRFYEGDFDYYPNGASKGLEEVHA